MTPLFTPGLSSSATAVQTRTSGGRPAYDLFEHRFELYVKAAPVFRAFGYRQVTMKALAHACGVSAPALYRYFPSKLDFALAPLDMPPDGYCATFLRQAAAAHADPLRGLRAALEAAVADIDLVVLALRLALEAGRDPGDPFATRDFESPAAAIGDVILQCVPSLGDRAHDLAHTLASLVITAAAKNEELLHDVLWRQAIPVLRAYLIDAGVDAARFDDVFAS